MQENEQTSTLNLKVSVFSNKLHIFEIWENIEDSSAVYSPNFVEKSP